MNDVEKTVDFYTDKYCENDRLSELCDNRHKVEREVKQKIYQDLIKKNSKILEIGAGTGVHSIFLSNIGNNVTACDIVPGHIDFIKKNAKLNNVTLDDVVLANALDLPFKNNEFDVVLLAGPIYHMKDTNNKKKAILEAKRVLKKNGLIVVDYLSLVHGFIQQVMKFPDFLHNSSIKDITELNCKDDIFSYNSKKEMEDLLMECEISNIKLFGTDGITRFIKDKINNLRNEEIEKWIEFIYKTSSNENIIDLSEHVIITGIKN